MKNLVACNGNLACLADPPGQVDQVDQGLRERREAHLGRWRWYNRAALLDRAAPEARRAHQGDPGDLAFLLRGGKSPPQR